MNDLSISKRAFWQYVNKKIKRVVHHYHVLSVINILFDEMIGDLLAGKTIKIHNFGKLSLKKLNPRKYFDVRFRKVMSAEGHRILRFKLAPIIRKKMVQHLDIDKTLKDD